MISSNERLLLVIFHKKKKAVSGIFDLGYHHLSSDEFDRLDLLATERGYTIYLTTATFNDKPPSFAALYNELQKLVTS